MSTPTRFAAAADRLLAVAFLALTQLEVWLFEADSGHTVTFRVVVSVLTLIASASLSMRRTRPLLAFALNGAAVISTIGVGFPSDFYQWTNLVVTYSVAAHASPRQAWGALPFALGGVLFYFARFPAEGGLVIAGFATAMWLVAWLAGRIYGSRVEEMRLRAERDVSRGIAAAQEERLALEDERARIARELHDIIGHSVNVMVVHAGAGQGLVETQPDQARQAFATIEMTGRAALGELDRVLAILRRDDPSTELAPLPGLVDLPELVATFTETGLAVGLEVDGDVSRVPPGVGLSAYRIVQEALTNTFRHAEASRATVSVSVDDRLIDLTVSDDGIGFSTVSEPGRGIRGMHERTAMHNGILAFSGPGTGASVSVTLHWEELE